MTCHSSVVPKKMPEKIHTIIMMSIPPKTQFDPANLVTISSLDSFGFEAVVIFTDESSLGLSDCFSEPLGLLVDGEHGGGLSDMYIDARGVWVMAAARIDSRCGAIESFMLRHTEGIARYCKDCGNDEVITLAGKGLQKIPDKD